jgi:branched-chain amino acid transport system permease protein
LFCGLAGSLYAFSKGTISPEVISVSRSVDGLVMVLLGGLQTLAGPIVGAAVFTWLQDTVARQTDYWQALLGFAILLLVIAFPQGIVGFVREQALATTMPARRTVTQVDRLKRSGPPPVQHHPRRRKPLQ